MKKKLYYVVEKELQSVDDNAGTQETTGMKTVSMYTIENDEMVRLSDLDLSNDESSTEAIQDYLNDNGHSDEEFTLIQL